MSANRVSGSGLPSHSTAQVVASPHPATAAGPTPAAAVAEPGLARSSAATNTAPQAELPGSTSSAGAQPTPARRFLQSSVDLVKGIWNGGLSQSRATARNENGEMSQAAQDLAQQNLATFSLFRSAPTTRTSVELSSLPQQVASLVAQSEQICTALLGGQTEITDQAGTTKTLVEASESLKAEGEKLRQALSNTHVFTLVPQRKMLADELEKWADKATELSDGASEHLHQKTPPGTETSLPASMADWPADIRTAADIATHASSINLDASAGYGRTMLRLLPLAIPLKIVSKIKDWASGTTPTAPHAAPVHDQTTTQLAEQNAAQTGVEHAGEQPNTQTLTPSS